MDLSFSNLNFNSVENLSGFDARAAFTVNFASVFREDVDIVPTIVGDSLSYVPLGGDNNMPFDILKLIEDDETLSTCQMFKSFAKSGRHFIVGCTPSAHATPLQCSMAHAPQLQCSMFFIPLDCLKNPTNNQFFFP